MKKTLSIILLSTLSFSTTLSFDLGVGKENIKWDGYIKNKNSINYFNNQSAETDGNNNTGNFGLEKKDVPYFYLKLEHPLPIIPNVEAKLSDYKLTGHSNYIAGGKVNILDFSIPTGLTNATTEIKEMKIDVSLYYKKNFNPLSLNYGLGFEYKDGNIKISGKEVNTNQEKEWVNKDYKLLIPYGYLNTDLKIYNFTLSGGIKYLKIKENTFSILDAKLKYKMSFSSFVVKPYTAIGYRKEHFFGKENDTSMKLDNNTVYIETGLTF